MTGTSGDPVAPEPDEGGAPDPADGAGEALSGYAIGDGERTQRLMELESARTDNAIRQSAALTRHRICLYVARTLVAFALAGAATISWQVDGRGSLFYGAICLTMVAGCGLLLGGWLRERRGAARGRVSGAPDETRDAGPPPGSTAGQDR